MSGQGVIGRTTVYFATNRVVNGPEDEAASYTSALQPPLDPSGMVYGTAFIDITNNLVDPPGTILSIESTAHGDFPAAVYDDLNQPGRNLLIFVHGFDNSFSDALIWAASNRDWMAGAGVAGADTTVLAFSWPSLGRIFGWPLLQSAYWTDQNHAVKSGPHLMAFFRKLAPTLRRARDNGSRTFLLAHSMGNLATESAVENWFLDGQGDAALPGSDADRLFDLAILAAADCAYNSFGLPDLGGLSGLSRPARRISIYYSDADAVLFASRNFNNFMQRLGWDGPKDKANAAEFPPALFNLANVTANQDGIDGPLATHQYYRRSPSVRALIAAEMAAT